MTHNITAKLNFLINRRWCISLLLIIALSCFQYSSIGSDNTADSDESSQEVAPPNSDEIRRGMPRPPKFKPGDPPSDKGPRLQGREQFPKMSRDENKDQMRVIEQFLQMPPERIRMMRELLERIEKMSPEEREKMLKRIRNYRNSSDEKRDKNMKFFHDLPLEDRMALNWYLRKLPSDESKKIRLKMRELPPEEKKPFISEILVKARKQFAEQRSDKKFSRRKPESPKDKKPDTNPNDNQDVDNSSNK